MVYFGLKPYFLGAKHKLCMCPVFSCFYTQLIFFKGTGTLDQIIMHSNSLVDAPIVSTISKLKWDEPNIGIQPILQ
jgi:hypothetical protein